MWSGKSFETLRLNNKKREETLKYALKFKIHPRKPTGNPENDGSQKESPFPVVYIQVSS